MAPLSAILYFFITFNYSFGYSLDEEQTVTWPKEYHFKMETINLFTGIVEPAEIWYSSKLNKSRIDFYDGTVKKYYYAKRVLKRGHIYTVHPETDQDGDVVVKCQAYRARLRKPADFLPSLDEYTYSEDGELNGVEVKIFTKTEETRVSKKEGVLYVYQTSEGENIPLKEVVKKFNKIEGDLQSHEITNFLNHDADFTKKVFDVKDLDCDSSVKNNFHETIDYLHPAIPYDVDLAFQGYKKHHNKNYEGEEHDFRKDIFRRNWKFIRDHNSQNLSYKMALNSFADQTDEELAYLTAAKPSYPLMQGTHPYPHTEAELEEIAQDFPEEYDMRTEGFVSRIKNQAHCGSCWAFAATAAIECALSRVNGGRNLDLSEQSLVDCAWPYGVSGCDGGFMDRAFEYVLHNGIPTEKDYGPYLQQDGYCHVRNMSSTYSIKGYTAVTSMSTNAMKAALLQHGPVAVGVFVTRGLKFYSSGVFYDLSCPENMMNHGVVVVGYGTRDGDLYWIVKNSWGEDWGEDGYVLMSAKDNNCNVMSVAFYPVA